MRFHNSVKISDTRHSVEYLFFREITYVVDGNSRFRISPARVWLNATELVITGIARRSSPADRVFQTSLTVLFDT